MAMTPEPGPTTVIGLGNPIMADDGLGLAALDRLRAEWELPADVVVADGGTWGMMLLPMIEASGRLLLLDAVRTGRSPGSFTRLSRSELPLYFSHKISPHQIDLREVLAVADLRGRLPERITVIGVEPELVDMRHGLSPVVEAQVGEVVRAAVDTLRAWGHACDPREPVTTDA